MAILIIAEHNHHKLNPATHRVLTAAKQLGGEIHLLVAGAECRAVAEEAATLEGVSSVLLADNPAYQHFLAENIAPLVLTIASSYSHILAAASTTGKDIMPRVAALLDVAQLSDIIAVISLSEFKRPIYAGNAIVTVESLDKIKVITVRTSAFAASTATGNNAAINVINPAETSDLSRFVSQEETASERPDLTSARIVVSGGRAFGSSENFTLLEKLATRLGAAIGASRAAVDAGYISNEYQVGQTGKIVAPDLYIAIGISGAIQHLAGMKESRIIVAINSDENAPIFEIADYGLVMDLFQALPELEKELG